MVVTGSVVLGVFGMVFTAFSALVGVIWSMQTRRIDALEQSLAKDRDYLNQTVKAIYEEIKGARKDISDFGHKCGERRADCTDKYVTKTDCDRVCTAREM